MFKAESNLRVSAGEKRGLVGSCFPLVVRLLLVLLYALQSTLMGASVSREYQVKAAFLYNFTKFVEWPPYCFPSDESPIVIGVLGKNPFGEELDKIVQDRKVNGRGFTVKIVQSVVDSAAVHLLFVPMGEELRLAAKKTGAIDLPGILTVGESDQFAELGGTINFVTEVDKVRFQINREATARAGVKISAQLLKLAVPGKNTR